MPVRVPIVYGFEKSLFNYKLFNHFIVDYYIAYRNSNMIVSPRKVYTVDQYYRMQPHYDDQPLSEWKQALFGQYHYKTYAPGHSVVYEGNLTRLSATCNPSGIKEAGVVTVLINNMQIQDMLRKVDPNKRVLPTLQIRTAT